MNFEFIEFSAFNVVEITALVVLVGLNEFKVLSAIFWRADVGMTVLVVWTSPEFVVLSEYSSSFELDTTLVVVLYSSEYSFLEIYFEMKVVVVSAGFSMLNCSKHKSPKRASRKNNKPINKIHLYFFIFNKNFCKSDNFSSTLILLGLM